jgi:hypothetical protein
VEPGQQTPLRRDDTGSPKFETRNSNRLTNDHGGRWSNGHRRRRDDALGEVVQKRGVLDAEPNKAGKIGTPRPKMRTHNVESLTRDNETCASLINQVSKVYTATARRARAISAPGKPRQTAQTAKSRIGARDFAPRWTSEINGDKVQRTTQCERDAIDPDEDSSRGSGDAE